MLRGEARAVDLLVVESWTFVQPSSFMRVASAAPWIVSLGTMRA